MLYLQLTATPGVCRGVHRIRRCPTAFSRGKAPRSVRGPAYRKRTLWKSNASKRDVLGLVLFALKAMLSSLFNVSHIFRGGGGGGEG